MRVIPIIPIIPESRFFFCDSVTIGVGATRHTYALKTAEYSEMKLNEMKGENKQMIRIVSKETARMSLR